MSKRVLWLLWALAFFAGSCSESSSENTEGKNGGSRKEFVSSYKGPKILLKAKFAPGEYELTEDMSIDGEVEAEGQRQPMKQNMVVGGGVVITEPDSAGEQSMRFTCERIKQSVTQGATTQQFDSEGSGRQDEELARLLRPLIGWGATVTVDSNGKFKRLEGIDSLMERVGSSGLPYQAREGLRKMMQKFLEEMLTKHWGELMPTTPVGPGDAWEGTIKVGSVPLLGNMEVKGRCRLRDIRETPGGNIAEVSFDVSISLRDKSVDLSEMGATGIDARIGTMTFRGGGTFEFDTSIGLSTRLDMRMSCDGDMAIRPPGSKEVKADLRMNVTYLNRLLRR